MNKNIIKQIVGLFFSCMLIIACSDEIENKNIPNEGDTTIEIDTKGILKDGLHCEMYIFKQEQGQSLYKMDKIVDFGNEDQKNVDFPNVDLNTCKYKLLFIAVPPANKNEIKIRNVSDKELTAGDLWTDVRMIATTQQPSEKFYYGIVEKSGLSIFNDGEIKCTLNRLVGQQAINIYKTSAFGTPPPPEGVSADVGSVIDRVFKIEIEYHNLTEIMAFDENTPVEQKQFGTPLIQTFEPIIDETTGNNFLKVKLPQVAKELFSLNGVNGSLEIKGPYGMPAKEKVRIKATFHYYHTTPSECTASNPENHTHTKKCFEDKTLILNLPHKKEQKLLTTKSDIITVNKGGIRYDRIIDVKAIGDFQFDTDWE